MEVSGVVFRPTQLFHGGFVDAHYAKISFSGHSSINAVNLVPSDLRLSSCRRSDICGRPRKWFGIGGSCRFSDNGHFQYYYESTRCGGGKKKKEKEAVKEKNAGEKARIKKKLRYLKGLSRNLLMFPEMGFVGNNGDDDELMVQGDMRKTISETTDILLAQLKQMKALKKEVQKKEKKEKKEKLKSAQMKTMADSESSSSSSSSSESSDSECDMVVNMKQLSAEPRVEAEPQTSTVQVETPVIPIITETKAENPLEQVQAEEPVLPCQSTPHEEVKAKESCSFQSEFSRVLEMQGRIECLSSLTSVAEQNCCGSGGCCSGGAVTAGGGGVVVGASSGRINVCLGGKCKKMGAAALLEEFQRRVGGEGSVVGCKCMGKCRSGPNVRVLSSDSEDKSRGNPLYIGVGSEDVGAIVSNYLGEKNNNLGLVTT